MEAQDAKKEATLDGLLERLYQRQQFEDAAKLLTQHLEVSKGDNKRRVELFRLLNYIGKDVEGIKILQKGLRQKESDNELLWHLGHAWLKRGDDGPNVSRSGGTVTYSPSKMTDEEEKTWKKVEYQKAAGAFRSLLKNNPKHQKAAEQLVRSLQGCSTLNELAGEVAILAEKFPGNLKIGLLYSDVLIEKNDLGKAAELLTSYREKSPRNGAVYRKLAEVYKAQEDNALMKESLAKADFYDWMPPFSKVEYTLELAKKIKFLQKNKDRNKLKQVVAGFIAENTQASTALMAVVCWHHLAHGAIENSCFEELEKRGEGDLLVSLIENAQSICTAREGGKALARMKHPEALRILSHLVVNDQRQIWITNAAEALEILADEQAVGVLIETADPGFKEADRQRSKQDADFMQNGPYYNRLRCLLALGSFDTDESKKALKEAAKNTELALVSEFALYRLTKEEEHLKKGFELAKEGLVFELMVVPYIKRNIKDAKSLAALKNWQKENPAKPEK